MILKTRDSNDSMKWKNYDFQEFEIFYSFIQKITPSYNALKSFRSFNWNSETIKERFLNFYNSASKTSLADIRKKLHFASYNCLNLNFWIDRGWTKDEAKNKISEIQKSNSKKVDPKNRSHNTQIKWWTKKGYTEEEAKNLIKERQATFTKEKCIQKYGKEKGKIVFKNRQQKWRRSLDKKYSKETQMQWARSCKGYSSQCTKLFLPVYEKLKNKYTCYLSPFTKEWFINKSGSYHFYLYDFCIKELNLIFEFNGSHVHANPNWSKETLKYWKNVFTKENAYDNIKHYNEKILAAKERGFDVIVIWDTDENPEKTIDFEISKKLQKLQQ